MTTLLLGLVSFIENSKGHSFLNKKADEKTDKIQFRITSASLWFVISLMFSKSISFVLF